ncbi:MAG: nitroreductase [Clostridia bacterium]|nr:nitroreductase [Clostridia bacterium]
MTIMEAMQSRHTVRKYTGRAIPAEILEQLEKRLEEHNKKYGLHMKLMINNEKAFGTFIKLILAKGVKNYIILAGEDIPGVDENLGYCGADMALLVQTFGLNSWWVGGTFHRKNVAKYVQGEKITGIIAIGYGATQGAPHKSKKAEEVSSYSGSAPEWFVRGVNAALLAPTALNKQAFMIKGEKNRVSISCHNGVFSETDLGIVKYHFEAGAGTEHFEWI